MSINWISQFAFAFITAAVISAAATACLIKILPKFNIMDVPNDRKVHKTPTPRMGGIAIFVGFVIPMLWMYYFSNEQKGIMLGAGITLVIGALDDLFHISAMLKLICLFLLTLILSQYGIITNFPFLPYYMNVLITMLWLTGVTSALNALDHMDGLAGGVSAIAGTMYLIVSIQNGEYFWGLVSISLIGSLVGYLIFNRHPAKIFMGDSGSFFLGFTLASIGLMGGWSSNPVKAAIVPIVILSIPIFDLIYVIAERRLKGTTKTLVAAIKYCGKDHIGHRLCDFGFSVPGSVRFIYLIAASVAFGAIALRHAGTTEAILIFIQIICIYLIIIIFMKNKKSSADH